MNKKHLSLAFALFACALLLGVWIGYSQTPSETFYISSGKYPGAPTYTVWIDGGNYFAKDDNGEIVYASSNASYVLNSVLNLIPSTTGGTILCKAGNWAITHTLVFPHGHIKFVGEGKEYTSFRVDERGAPFINITSTTPYVVDKYSFTILEGFTCWSSASGFDHNYIHLEGTSAGGSLTQIAIRNVRLVSGDSGSIGIYANNVYSTIVRDCTFRSMGQGIHLNEVGNFGNNVWLIEDCDFWYMKNTTCTIYMDRCSYTTLNNILFDQLTASNNITYGIWLNSCRQVKIGRLVFSDNSKPDVAGVYITSTSGTWMDSSFIELDNLFTQSFDYGVYVGNYSHNIVINSPECRLDDDAFLYVEALASEVTVISPDIVGSETYKAGNVGAIYTVGAGYQNSGNSEASNDDWIEHNLTSTPTSIVLTVQETDANYYVQHKASNTTHFQIYLYDATAAALETTDKTINWIAEYQP